MANGLADWEPVVNGVSAGRRISALAMIAKSDIFIWLVLVG